VSHLVFLSILSFEKDWSKSEALCIAPFSCILAERIMESAVMRKRLSVYRSEIIPF
jgi:hypothetical protein